MKNAKTAGVIGILSAITGIILLICVKYIVPVCKGMLELTNGKQVPMKCNYTGIVLTLIGIVIIINAIMSIASKQKLPCAIMMIVLALFMMALLSKSIGIGVCMNPDMACNKTALVVKILAAVELVLGGLMAVIVTKKS